MAWWYDDFRVGRRVETPGRVVELADIDAFAALTGDDHPLHVDDAYATAEEFGGRVAHGLLGLAVAVGLLRRAEVLGEPLLALLGVADWRFRAPVRPGDRVRAVATVAVARPSASRPGQGIVELAVEVWREDDAVAQAGRLTLLVRQRRG